MLGKTQKSNKSHKVVQLKKNLDSQMEQVLEVCQNKDGRNSYKKKLLVN